MIHNDTSEDIEIMRSIIEFTTAWNIGELSALDAKKAIGNIVNADMKKAEDNERFVECGVCGDIWEDHVC